MSVEAMDNFEDNLKGLPSLKQTVLRFDDY